MPEPAAAPAEAGSGDAAPKAEGGEAKPEEKPEEKAEEKAEEKGDDKED